MKRREFVVRCGSLLVVLPLGQVLVGCGGDDGEGRTLTFTSTVNQQHAHTVQIQESAISSPPSGGLQRDTSTDAGHMHRVSLTAAELTTLANGGSVTKETTVDSGHSHSFTFTKA